MQIIITIYLKRHCTTTTTTTTCVFHTQKSKNQPTSAMDHVPPAEGDCKFPHCTGQASCAFCSMCTAHHVPHDDEQKVCGVCNVLTCTTCETPTCMFDECITVQEAIQVSATQPIGVHGLLCATCIIPYVYTQPYVAHANGV